jgi:hypothetical protein
MLSQGQQGLTRLGLKALGGRQRFLPITRRFTTSDWTNLPLVSRWNGAGVNRGTIKCRDVSTGRKHAATKTCASKVVHGASDILEYGEHHGNHRIYDKSQLLHAFR